MWEGVAWEQAEIGANFRQNAGSGWESGMWEVLGARYQRDQGGEQELVLEGASLKVSPPSSSVSGGGRQGRAA